MQDRFNRSFLQALLAHWNLELMHVRPDDRIDGSPERTLSRVVIADVRERMFVLEEIAPAESGRKQQIALILEYLSRQGLQKVHPWLEDRQGKVVTEYGGRCWQLRPYIPGSSLPRSEYLGEAWRGIALADFLIDLRIAASNAGHSFAGAPFSVVDFIHTLIDKLAAYHPEILSRIKPALGYLADEFFGVHDNLPLAFCHGDYHPLNVIWSEAAILSVIDWEFCGVKTEAYDLALLLGCLGMEDPLMLNGPLIRSLLQRIIERNLYDERSLKCLPELVMTLRFAWLSEWLRKNDMEMVCLELDYLSLLFHNQSAIKSAWRCF